MILIIPVENGARNLHADQLAVLGTRIADVAIPGNAQLALNACQAAWRSKSSVDLQRGENWAHAAMCMTLFNTVGTPNDFGDSWTYCSRIGSGARSDFNSADSYHAGGVNVTMADGSVRFIKDSVNQRTWMALGTKAGGEVISSDSY